MKYSHVLWDFNGTVLDDVSTGIKAINALLSRRKMKTLDTLEEYHAHFGFPIIEYYGRLGFDFEKEPYSRIAVEWVEEYNRFVLPELREAAGALVDSVPEDVQYVDFNDGPPFPADAFMDTDHLSAAGAQQVSRMLRLANLLVHIVIFVIDDLPVDAAQSDAGAAVDPFHITLPFPGTGWDFHG